MSTPTTPLHIGVFGWEGNQTEGGRGCGLWAAGYESVLTAAGATPVRLGDSTDGKPWKEILAGLDGLVFTGGRCSHVPPRAEEERLFRYCRKHRLPLLAINHGLHALNTVFGGTLYLDLARELPEALQHRHPPEPGVRHAISVERGTRLAQIYGEGELVVNSEHRSAVNRVARGFRVGGRALDGVIEAIEAEDDSWFVVGVQWHPASATASGLDIQLFRALIDAARQQVEQASQLAACAAA